MAVDGHLNFDTKIDTKGFNSGISLIKKATNGIASVFGKINDTIKRAFDSKIINSFSDNVGSAATKLSQKFGELQAKVHSFLSSFNTNEIHNGINEVNDSVNSISPNLKKIADTLGVALSVSTIISFGKKAIETAASVNAEVSQMNQTFGSMKDAATSAMKSVADQSGILQARLQAAGTSIYAFARTSGMGQAEAIDMMSEALQVAADSAAYYDRSLEDTTETLKSYLKGNYANDAALGLASTETTRNAKAMQLYGKSFIELSEAQKQLALLDMVKDANRASGALGQAARESEGWENVLGNLKESWRQLVSVMGQPLLQIVIPAIQTVTSALQSLTAKAQAAYSVLAKMFGWQESQTEAIDSSVESQDDLTAAVKETEKAQKGTLAGFDTIMTLSEKTAEASAPMAAAQATSSNDSASALTPVNSNIDTSAETEKLEQYQKAFENLQVVLKPVTDSLEILWGKLKKLSEPFGEGLSYFKDTILIPLGDWFLQNLLPTSIDLIGTALDTFGVIINKISPYVTEFLENVLVPLGEWAGDAFISALERVIEKLEDFQKLVSGEITLGEFLSDLSLLETTLLAVAVALTTVAVASAAFSTIKTVGSAVGTVFSLLTSPIGLVVAGIALLVVGIIELIKHWDDVKEKFGNIEIFDSVKEGFENVIKIIKKFWDKTLDPIWKHIQEISSKIWNESLKPLLDNILDLFGSIISGTSELFNKTLAPIIGWIVDTFGPIIANSINNIIDKGASILQFIIDVVSGIIESISGIIDFIVGIFTLDFEKALSGIEKIFSGLWNTVKNGFIDFINFIITGINSMIDGILSPINAMISGWNNSVGKVVGTIPEISISIPTIPKLATGTVIPPNREFLAILGDQKSGTNIETPLDTMLQAFKQALSEGGYGQNQTVVLELDGRELGRTIVRLGKQENNRVGSKLRTT